MKLLSGILTLSGIITCAALIAYDCEDSKANITVIALGDVAPCPDEIEDYVEETVKIQVIQKNKYTLQKVQACLVEVLRHIHTSAVEKGLSSYIHAIGAEECRTMHRYRTIQLFNQNIGNIIINGTITAAITIAGALNTDSTCEGITYTENGYTWKKVVIMGTIKITTREYYATVILEENLISLTTGITCSYLQAYCIDSTYGETTWDINIAQSCEDKLTELYSGKAQQITNKQNPFEKLIIVDQEEKIFAFALKSKAIICDANGWYTEHPQIIIIIKTNSTTQLLARSNLIPQNTNMFSYINSKLLYVEQSNKREINKVYRNTAHRRCELHREIIRNRLSLAPLTPNSISTLIKQELGYIAAKMGEVLYIMKCTPRVVYPRKTETCYQELPIWNNNQSKFMAPITHIIQAYAQPINCNRITPPIYLIDGTWTAITPVHIEKKPPTYLQVDEGKPLQLEPIQQIGERGLYTQEEITKIQEQLTFGNEREAVENIIIRKIKGMETNSMGYSTVQIFDMEEMKQLTSSILTQIYGWFATFGQFFSGIIGIYIVIRIIKYVFGVMLNGLTIYKTFGFGIQLIASVWNTLTLWLVQN
ncbi:uncharacterized protein LOC116166512 [Photinus pyralis]|nr:uncharacterized protein LOC116166512 [Photinus pyralis]